MIEESVHEVGYCCCSCCSFAIGKGRFFLVLLVILVLTCLYFSSLICLYFSSLFVAYGVNRLSWLAFGVVGPNFVFLVVVLVN